MTNTGILIDLPVPIITSRIVLRPPMDGDGQAVYEAADESYADLSKWMIWAWPPRENLNVDLYESFCRQKQAKFILREQLTFICFDRENKTLIGSASLNQCDWDHGIFNLGYWVRTSRTGQGYATEAGAALCHYAFDVLGAKRISSHHAEGNDSSGKVLEKLGFQKEAIHKNQHKIGDMMIDEHVYGLNNKKKLMPLGIQY